MTADRLRSHLGDGERLRAVWTGEVTGGRMPGPAVVGATDRRLVYVAEDGSAGDVDYRHVTAIESRPGVETSYEGLDYRLVVAAGAAVALGAFAAAVGAGSGTAALAFVLVSVGGVAVSEYGWRHREDLDGIRRVRAERRRVTVATVDGRTRELSLPADGDAGAELSRLVRTGAGVGSREGATPPGGVPASPGSAN